MKIDVEKMSIHTNNRMERHRLENAWRGHVWEYILHADKGGGTFVFKDREVFEEACQRAERKNISQVSYKCGNCDRKVYKYYKFCPSCGKPLENV